MNTFRRKQSPEMKSVLKIINANEELKRKALPFIDTNREAIHWPGIWSEEYNEELAAALTFAEQIWVEKSTVKLHPLSRNTEMTPLLSLAMAEVLSIEWKLNR